MVERLGPALATRDLHFFLVLDVSGSMEDHGKIGALNDAIRSTIPALREAEASNPGIRLLVRAVAFSEHAWWHVVEPTPIAELSWVDIPAIPQGVTETGLAIDLVVQELAKLGGRRGLPPAIVLVSDGQPTTFKQPDYPSALSGLLSDPWGSKASRVAIGIGHDADMASLAQFTADPQVPPVQANRAEELVHYLKWASTMAVDASSQMVRSESPISSDATMLDDLPPPTDGPVRVNRDGAWDASTMMDGGGVATPPPLPPPIAAGGGDSELTW